MKINLVNELETIKIDIENGIFDRDELQELIDRSIEWLQAIDDDLVCSHIGTIDNMEPKDAINKLGVYNQSVGEYFAREKMECKSDTTSGEF